MQNLKGMEALPTVLLGAAAEAITCVVLFFCLQRTTATREHKRQSAGKKTRKGIRLNVRKKSLKDYGGRQVDYVGERANAHFSKPRLATQLESRVTRTKESNVKFSEVYKHSA